MESKLRFQLNAVEADIIPYSKLGFLKWQIFPCYEGFMDIMSVKAKKIAFGIVAQGIRQNNPYNQFLFFGLLVLVWAFALYAYCENLGEKVRVLVFLIKVLTP